MASGCFSIPHYVIKNGWLRGARHGKTEAQEQFFWPTTRGGDVSKRIWWNSRTLPARFSFSWFATQNWLDRGEVHRDGYWHRRTFPFAHPLRSTREIRKIGISHWKKSGRNAPMKLRSDFRIVVAIMNRLHRESGEGRPEPIPFHHYQMWQSSSSSSISWWQWNGNWWGS